MLIIIIINVIWHIDFFLISYREKIRVGRLEIIFFLNIFFHGFGVFFLGDLQ